MSLNQKRRLPRKKKRSVGTKNIFSTIDYKKWISAFCLLCFFIFSILFAGYVIFFRTVLAQEVTESSQQSIVFEEPTGQDTHIVERKILSDVHLPLVSIIIDDMGYDRQLGKKLLALDMELCFSFLPFAPYTQELDAAAFRAGRTVLLHLPLEPKNKIWNPGPGALRIGEEKERVQELFEKNLNNVPHAIGVNNHMGSLYSENNDVMKNLIDMIKAKELFYIDSFTASKSVGMLLASKAGVKTARRHVFLDNVPKVEKVCEQLEKLVETAEKQGFAIGIGHPHEATLQALSSCMVDFSSRVKLVRVTDLIH